MAELPSQSQQWSQTRMVPLFQDDSFSNGSQAVQPLDFHYRLSDQGRIVLGQLSSEETVEFELLSRRDREGLMDLPSELRLLELYVKYIGVKYIASGAGAALTPPEPASQASGPLQRRRPPPARAARPRDYILSMIVIASVSFTLIALLVA